MGKITKIDPDECRVIVEPDIAWLIGEHKGEIAKDRCEEILVQVKRHVDDVGHAYVEAPIRDRCEYCNSIWEEDEDGCPPCCNAAVEEFEKEKP